MTLWLVGHWFVCVRTVGAYPDRLVRQFQLIPLTRTTFPLHLAITVVSYQNRYAMHTIQEVEENQQDTLPLPDHCMRQSPQSLRWPFAVTPV